MNEMLSTGMFLLLVCSVLTGLIVEGLKKLITIDKPNVVAAIVSIITGAIVSLAYIAYTHMSFSIELVLFVVALIVLSWLCAMNGYDKVVQTLAQIFSKPVINKEE